jgi:hypothetical protein
VTHRIIKATILILAIVVGGLVARNKSRPSSSKPTSSSTPSTESLQDFKSDPNQTLAVVGDMTITGEDLAWEVDLHSSVPKIATVDANITDSPGSLNSQTSSLPVFKSKPLWNRLFVGLLERKLLYLWIREHSEGFDHENPNRYINCINNVKVYLDDNDPFFASNQSKDRLKSKLCEQDLIHQYIIERIEPKISISAQELESYYKGNPKEFQRSARISFLQILLPNEAQAKSVRLKVNRNNFAQLAKEHSISPEGQNGGKMGPFQKEQLPSFFSIVFNMQIGEISDIVRSPYGFHILMLTEKHSAGMASLAESTKTIESKLRKSRSQELVQDWLVSAMNIIPVRTSSEKDQ